MNTKQLRNLGIPKDALPAARRAAADAAADGMKKSALRKALRETIDAPDAHIGDKHFGPLAEALLKARKAAEAARQREAEYAKSEERERPAFYRSFGEGLDANSVEQMENACRLPVAMRGALMPDAHLGYGLPIGGVLATRGAVIPYAVGVDIACRMKLTVLDLPVGMLKGNANQLAQAIEGETRFGVGASFGRHRREHRVMDEDWSVSPATARLKDKAWDQLGTSGSGNHFVEFGTLKVSDDRIGIATGTYLALLSHSGSRGAGNEVATTYSRLARSRHPELPKTLNHLAWLDLDTEEGQEYWLAMELMGRYAAANHELIHRHIAEHLGAETVLDVENHHNFAWRERHTPDADGEGEAEEVIVHRKGATPAQRGTIGVIPGSMASPGYVVMGRGVEASLQSASHGAGRVMSRKQAKQRLNWRDVERFLKEKGIHVLSAGLDEVPMVYKNIDEVMAAQSDLVEVLARFDPKIVKMAPPGHRAEN